LLSVLSIATTSALNTTQRAIASETASASRAAMAAAWSAIQKKNSSESMTADLATSAHPQRHSRSGSVASVSVSAQT